MSRRLQPRPKQRVADLIALAEAAGLVGLQFSPRAHYWCVVGLKG